MKMLVTKRGIIFAGKIKDLKNIFANFSANITLSDFIRMYLN